MPDQHTEKPSLEPNLDALKDKPLKEVLTALHFEKDTTDILTAAASVMGKGGIKDEEKSKQAERNLRTNILRIASDIGGSWRLDPSTEDSMAKDFVSGKYWRWIDRGFIEVCKNQADVGENFSRWYTQYGKLQIPRQEPDVAALELYKKNLTEFDHSSQRWKFHPEEADKELTTAKTLSDELRALGVNASGNFIGTLDTIGEKRSTDAIGWIRQMKQAGIPMHTLEDVNQLLIKLDILRFPPGKEMAGVSILRKYNIRIESLSVNVLTAITDELLMLISTEDDSFEAVQDRFSIFFLEKSTTNEIKDIVKNVFRDEKSCERLNPLLMALIKKNRAEKTYDHSTELDLLKFLSDPSMGNIQDVIAFIPQTAFRDNPKYPIMIGRNLHRKGTPVTRESVDREREDIEAFRRTMKDTPVLGPDRAVTLVANNESAYKNKKTGDFVMQSTLQRKMLMKEAKLEDFERVPRFGTPAYVERLKAAGGPLHVIRPITNDLEMANNSYKKKFGEITAEAKADILRKKDQVFQEMVSVPPPHTFIFDGHGLDDTFFLGSGGDRKKGNAPATDAGALHYKYFAKALRNRYEKFKTQSPLLQKDVFIFESCYSTNLTMNTDAALKGTDYRPIFIATNEYGQVGFTDLEQATGSKFSANVLGLKEAKKQTITLGDIMRRQDEGDSNVSIFIPRKDKPIEETILEQITQLPEKEKGNTDTPERKAA